MATWPCADSVKHLQLGLVSFEAMRPGACGQCLGGTGIKLINRHTFAQWSCRFQSCTLYQLAPLLLTLSGL